MELKEYAHLFEKQNWRQIIEYSNEKLEELGVNNSNARKAMLWHFWRIKKVLVKYKHL